jgi:hypothetical protein
MVSCVRVSFDVWVSCGESCRVGCYFIRESCQIPPMHPIIDLHIYRSLVHPNNDIGAELFE